MSSFTWLKLTPLPTDLLCYLGTSSLRKSTCRGNKAAVPTCKIRTAGSGDRGLEWVAWPLTWSSSSHLLMIGKWKRWQQRHDFFCQRKTFINKHLEHLRVTTGLTLHGSTALFVLPHLSQLSKCQSNCCLFSILSPYLIFQHSGMFTTHMCHTNVILTSTTPCTRVTILTQLHRSVGA